jgi:hypothetical protein
MIDIAKEPVEVRGLLLGLEFGGLLESGPGFGRRHAVGRQGPDMKRKDLGTIAARELGGIGRRDFGHGREVRGIQNISKSDVNLRLCRGHVEPPDHNWISLHL